MSEIGLLEAAILAEARGVDRCPCALANCGGCHRRRVRWVALLSELAHRYKYAGWAP